MAKLLAENLNEYKENEKILNEEQLNEGIANQYAKLNKGDEKSVRQFVLALANKKYVTAPGASSNAAKKLIAQLASKLDIKLLLGFLEKAAADNFAGRTIIPYADPQAKTGRTLGWKLAANIKTQNAI